MATKYAVILPDGAADEALPELGGRTPLDVAKTPNMDWVAMHGRQGTVQTVPRGFEPGSDVATLSVLGYSPQQHYTGRAPIEAVARKIKLDRGDVVFRCNFVTIIDGRMEDYSAGKISTEEAGRLIDELNRQLGSDTLQFHAGVSYRNLLVFQAAKQLNPRCTPPHQIPGQPVKHHLPSGRGAKRIRQLMARAEQILADHDVNHVRRDLGENPATAIWLWGHGRLPQLPRFRERFGLRGAVVAAVDLVRGIGTLLGWQVIDVEGATGYLDTNYAGKGAAAVRALDDYDLVVVHVEAADEAAHDGNLQEKITAIERIDQHVVGPVLHKLQGFGQDWKILIAPDHPTPVRSMVHTTDPPPFCMAGKGVVGVFARPFSEANAAASDLHIERGHELMEYFLKP
jgi:2,3-bisphosphoglycerate-independent phosphoglycerate mutase